jgi:hypothetical protein
MRKIEKKLQLNRETVLRLDRRPLTRQALEQANGGGTEQGIDWTGCMSECTECGGALQQGN